MDHKARHAGRRAAVDDKLVRRRTVTRQKGVHRDRAASSHVAGRRQDRARRSARAHVHQAGIDDAGYGLVEAIEIERSAVCDRHRRIRAERVQRACSQDARVDIRRSAVAVGSSQRGGAREHIDSTVAADRGRKHVVGGRVVEVDRTGASAKCDARVAVSVPGAAAGLPAGAPMLSVPIEPALFAITTLGVATMPPSAIVSVPVPELPILIPAMSLQREPAPVTVTVPCEPAPSPMLVRRGVISMTLPPFAIMRVPVPKLPILSPPCGPLVQVEPGPVTITVPVEPAANPTEEPVLLAVVSS